MVTKSEAFPSRFLNGSNVTRPMVLNIEFVKQEELETPDGRRQTKTVVYFNNCKQLLACGPVLFDAIVDVTGEVDSDDWAGHRVEVYPSTCEVGGKVKACVRVRTPGTTTEAETKSKSKPKPKPRPSLKDELDDEIPL
jgi:hypothetical protein